MSEQHFNRAVLHFPQGLIGLPDLKHFEIAYDPEELPFMHLRETKSDGLEFVVIKPHGLVPDYTLKISDEDIKFLKVKEGDDILIVNVATVHQKPQVHVTLNLIAPLIVNLSTFIGKQVVLENYQEYSANFLLPTKV